MAQQIMVRLLDDLDPTKEADETLKFSVDGVEYEIDLSHDHASKFRTFVDAYVKAGRRVGGRRKRRNANHGPDPEGNGIAPMMNDTANGTVPRPTAAAVIAQRREPQPADARKTSPPAANFKSPASRTQRPLENVNLNRTERDAVRRWAPTHGFVIGDRGRIAAPIITAWRAAGSPR